MESQVISDGEGIMRVWKIDKKEDSLFLRMIAKPLTGKDLDSPVLEKLKKRMLLTVNDPTDPGVGIAAPQVGVSRQIIAVQRFDKTGEPFEFYVNSEITYYSAEQLYGVEGCLSIPERQDSVWRSEKIILRHTRLNEQGQLGQVVDTVSGFTAVIFQHEIDHLHGILYIDRIK